MKKNLLYLPLWMKLLPELKKGNVFRASVTLDVTYSHVTKISNEFVKKGWIIKTREGRENNIVFTNKGEQIEKLCLSMVMDGDLIVPK